MIYILIYLNLLMDTVLQFSLLPFNIVFGCKQTQRYSRTHQLGFIRAFSGSAQNAESQWSPVHITLIAEHFCFYAFYKYGLQRDLMSCSSRLMLQRP